MRPGSLFDRRRGPVAGRGGRSGVLGRALAVGRAARGAGGRRRRGRGPVAVDFPALSDDALVGAELAGGPGLDRVAAAGPAAPLGGGGRGRRGRRRGGRRRGGRRRGGGGLRRARAARAGRGGRRVGAAAAARGRQGLGRAVIQRGKRVVTGVTGMQPGVTLVVGVRVVVVQATQQPVLHCLDQ